MGLISKFIIILLLFISVVSIVSSTQVVYNNKIAVTTDFDKNKLNGLDDVNTQSPTDGQVIAFNSTSGEWYNTFVNSTAGANSTSYWDRTGTTLSPVNSGDDINMNGGSIIANMFSGLFNWTEDSPYLSFDGNLLSYNESKLNETILLVSPSTNMSLLNDTYVNIDGDTMTGDLQISDNSSALKSGNYPIQFMSGSEEGAGTYASFTNNKIQVEVTLSTTTPKNNYQVKLTLDNTFDYASMGANGDSLRFTDGTDIFDYWIEEWTYGTSATIWVEVATSGTGTIWMTYGNSSLPSYSNGNNTFIEFDDFDGSSLDAKWTVDTGVTATVSGGKVDISTSANSWGTWAGVHTGITTQTSGVAVEMRDYTFQSWTYNALGKWGVLLGTSGSNFYGEIGVIHNDNHFNVAEAYEQGTNDGTAMNSINRGSSLQTHDYSARRDDVGNIEYFMDGVSVATGTGATNTVDTLMILANKIAGYLWIDTWSVGTVFVREFDGEINVTSYGTPFTGIGNSYILDTTTSYSNSDSKLLSLKNNGNLKAYFDIYGGLNSNGNITGNWFKGLFNWTEDSPYLSFDGNLLSYNETKLNETILSESSVYNNSADINSINTTSNIEVLVNDSYVNVAGDTMNGILNMSGNNLIDINKLISPDGSTIGFGGLGIFDGMDNAINFYSNQSLTEGQITHALTQDGKIIEAWQSGKNNSAGFHRNSQLIFGDLGYTNASILTSSWTMWDSINITSSLDYYTGDTGADLGVQDGIEAQQLYLHNDLGRGLLFVQGIASFIGNGIDDFDIYNTSALHLKRPDRLENVTVNGSGITIFNIDWNGILDGGLPIPFTQLTSGSKVRQWNVRTEAGFCHNLQCIRAKGGDGGIDRIIEYNFTTLNSSDLNLTFWYGSDNMDGVVGDAFSVTANNNIGSGEVTIFNDTTTSADINPAIFKNFTLPVSMENKSVVSIRFYHKASGTGEESFVDDLKLTATFGNPTIIEQTISDGKIEFGDGTCNIIVNGSSSQTMNLSCGNIITDNTLTSSNSTILGNLNNGNYSSFDDEGFLSLNGNSRVIKEVDMRAIDFGYLLGTPATFGNVNQWDVLRFDDTTIETGEVNFEIPEDIDLSINPTLELYVMPQLAQTVGSNFTFRFRMKYRGAGDDLSLSVEQDSTITQNVSNTAKILTKIKVPLDRTHMSAGDLANVRLDRQASDVSDDRNGDADIIAMHFRYVSNSIGEQYNGGEL